MNNYFVGVFVKNILDVVIRQACLFSRSSKSINLFVSCSFILLNYNLIRNVKFRRMGKYSFYLPILIVSGFDV